MDLDGSYKKVQVFELAYKTIISPKIECEYQKLVNILNEYFECVKDIEFRNKDSINMQIKSQNKKLSTEIIEFNDILMDLQACLEKQDFVKIIDLASRASQLKNIIEKKQGDYYLCQQRILNDENIIVSIQSKLNLIISEIKEQLKNINKLDIDNEKRLSRVVVSPKKVSELFKEKNILENEKDYEQLKAIVDYKRTCMLFVEMEACDILNSFKNRNLLNKSTRDLVVFKELNEQKITEHIARYEVNKSIYYHECFTNYIKTGNLDKAFLKKVIMDDYIEGVPQYLLEILIEETDFEKELVL